MTPFRTCNALFSGTKHFQLKLAFYFAGVLTAFLYVGSISGEWLLSWDDQIYIVDNPLIKTISVDNILKIFSSFYYTDYHPLQLLSYMIDYGLWKSNPVGYRITNIVLHVISGIMVFVITRKILRITSCIPLHDRNAVAAAASYIFLSHPTAVESVIWISERKNVLSTAFMLMSFYAYITYREMELKKFFYLSLLLFIFALLSKASTVVLPIFIVLLDNYLYPVDNKRSKTVWLEKAPFFVLSLVSGILTVNAQAYAGAVKDYPDGNLWYQLSVSIRALTYYVSYSFFPINLSAYYAVPLEKSVFESHAFIALIVLLSLFVIAIYSIKRFPIIFFCIGWFFVSLFPVSGIIPLSNFMADRYLYIPMVGFAIFLSLSIYSLSISFAEKTGIKKAAVIYLIPISLIIFEFSGLTLARAKIWEEELILWEDTLHKEPRAPYLYGALGKAYLDKGMPEAALVALSKGLEMLKENSEVAKDIRYTRGYTFYCMGDYAGAVRDFERLIQIDSNYPSAYFGLMLTYRDAGDKEKALRAIERYIELFALIPKGKVYVMSLEDATKVANSLREELQKGQR